jgi:serine phosphatase RsbU (regulator of sigma subunit)
MALPPVPHRSRGGWPLRARLVLLVSAVVTVSLGVISSYFIFQQQREHHRLIRAETQIIRDQLRRKGLALVRNVAASSQAAIAVMDFLFLTEVIGSTVRGDDEILYGILMDNERRALVHSQPQLAGRVLDTPADRAAAGFQEVGIQEVSRGGERVLEVIAPVLVADERWGTVRFGLSLRGLDAQIASHLARAEANTRRGIVGTLITAVVLILLGSAVGAMVAGRTIHPLERLLAGVRHIEAGELGHKVAVQGSPEFVGLADAFNDMSGRLGSLLEEMAGKASLEREMDVARSLQQRMSPAPELVTLDGMSLVGSCDMADACGGDWWTYRQLPDGRILVLIGDVTGHGLPAAIIASTARGAFEAITLMADDHLTPVQVLEGLHRAIVDVGQHKYFMTCFALLYDPARGIADFANAGHLAPFVLTPAAGNQTHDVSAMVVVGNPLGAPDIRFGRGRQRLGAGDVILLTTDGLHEYRNGRREEFGNRRMLRMLRSNRIAAGSDGVLAFKEQILGDVRRFGDGAPLEDDMTLVVCRVEQRRERHSGQGKAERERAQDRDDEQSARAS